MGIDKEKKEGKRDHQLWLQLDAGVSSVLGHTHGGSALGFLGVPFQRKVFPTLDINISFSMQNSYHVQFVFPDLSGNGLAGFGWSQSPLQSMPSSQPHSCTCTALCLSPRDRSRALSQKSAALSPATSCSFSQCGITYIPCLSIPRALGWAHSHSAISV